MFKSNQVVLATVVERSKLSTQHLSWMRSAVQISAKSIIFSSRKIFNQFSCQLNHDAGDLTRLVVVV